MRDRRTFLKTTALAAGSLYLPAEALTVPESPTMRPADLPAGDSPAPVPVPHFPDRLHALVFRNWQLVPAERLAKVVGATHEQILELGRSMGLAGPPRITADQQRRSYLTVIRRNWHLLPYEQLLDLLGWTAEQMAYSLREDDFLFVKLGNRKPKCAPLRYAPPDDDARKRAAQIAVVLREELRDDAGAIEEPLFSFVSRVSRKPSGPAPKRGEARFAPRFCYSYFALYGDPLLDTDTDPYPDGYLAQLAAAGVDGVWLQAVLYKLAPFQWDPWLSEGYQKRRENLRALVARARRHGIRVFLYLNEPRAMPLAFYERLPELKGALEGDHAALCTSVPGVQQYITSSVEAIARAVPDLGGFFTITASENLTNCWSHHHGETCPRCGKRTPAEVIAEVNGVVAEGIRRAGTAAELIAWDWGWADSWAPDAIRRLPKEAALQSVSEWSLPVRRGGVETAVGEYSISAIGPGPRATKHWQVARERGLKTSAKIQAGNTWELSAVPYIPAVENVARHVARLRDSGVGGLMLGWTLGGYPSPNLEVVAEIGSSDATPDEAMLRVAERRYGKTIAPAVVAAWKTMSAAFSEFPYHGQVVYNAPLQVGPANPLWGERTGYGSTMVGLPYDDLNGWRAVYPVEAFVGQLEKVADGFDAAVRDLRAAAAKGNPPGLGERGAIAAELNVAEAAAIHFRAVAQQARFVEARDRLAGTNDAAEAHRLCDELERLLEAELDLAKRLHAIQNRDSRIGFEASNQYYYVPADLAEKIVNCRDLLQRWLPAQRARFDV